jgi:hypothetical protein
MVGPVGRDLLAASEMRRVMQLKPGIRLRSVISTAEVIVLRGPSEEVDLTCGGRPMAPPGAEAAVGDADASEDILAGKRYVDESLGVEVLCTKSGAGDLACNGAAMTLRSAKPLPSTD